MTECRICRDDSQTTADPLIHPCNCNGSIKFVHRNCIKKYAEISVSDNCPTCKTDYATVRITNGGIALGKSYEFMIKYISFISNAIVVPMSAIAFTILCMKASGYLLTDLTIAKIVYWLFIYSMGCGSFGFALQALADNNIWFVRLFIEYFIYNLDIIFELFHWYKNGMTRQVIVLMWMTHSYRYVFVLKWLLSKYEEYYTRNKPVNLRGLFALLRDPERDMGGNMGCDLCDIIDSDVMINACFCTNACHVKCIEKYIAVTGEEKCPRCGIDYQTIPVITGPLSYCFPYNDWNLFEHFTIACKMILHIFQGVLSSYVVFYVGIIITSADWYLEKMLIIFLVPDLASLMVGIAIGLIYDRDAVDQIMQSLLLWTRIFGIWDIIWGTGCIAYWYHLPASTLTLVLGIITSVRLGINILLTAVKGYDKHCVTIAFGDRDP